MKLSTVTFLLAACLWMSGYLHYGWLLFQTVASATSLWIAVAFSIQFFLWLFPMTGLVALIVKEKLEPRKR